MKAAFNITLGCQGSYAPSTTTQRQVFSSATRTTGSASAWRGTSAASNTQPVLTTVSSFVSEDGLLCRENERENRREQDGLLYTHNIQSLRTFLVSFRFAHARGFGLYGYLWVAPAKNNFICESIVKRDKRMRDAVRDVTPEHPHA
jgi:hypothetical protein